MCGGLDAQGLVGSAVVAQVGLPVVGEVVVPDGHRTVDATRDDGGAVGTPAGITQLAGFADVDRADAGVIRGIPPRGLTVNRTSANIGLL